MPSHRGCGGFCPAEVINVFLGYVRLPAPPQGKEEGWGLTAGWFARSPACGGGSGRPWGPLA